MMQEIRSAIGWVLWPEWLQIAFLVCIWALLAIFPIWVWIETAMWRAKRKRIKAYMRSKAVNEKARWYAKNRKRGL